MTVIEMMGMYGPNKPKTESKKAKTEGNVIDEESRKELRMRDIGRRKRGGQKWTGEEHGEFECHGYYELNDYLETSNCEIDREIIRHDQ